MESESTLGCDPGRSWNLSSHKAAFPWEMLNSAIYQGRASLASGNYESQPGSGFPG